MEFLSLLWLPILISGVVLFIASSVAWTMMPHHKTDWKKTTNEDELMSAIGKFNMPAGSYMFHPAGGVHWDGSNSDDTVIVQIIGEGPVTSADVDPSLPGWVKLPG